MLTSKQRAYLRSLAVNEDTILMMGKSGMSPELVKQADDALEKRELIKGRVLPESSPMTSREAAEAIAHPQSSIHYILSGKAVARRTAGRAGGPPGTVNRSGKFVRRDAQSMPT